MTIDEGIARLGESFRGLRISYRVNQLSEPPEKWWCVAFIHHGEYRETIECPSAESALELAVTMLEEW